SNVSWSSSATPPGPSSPFGPPSADMKMPPGPQCTVCGREYPDLAASSSASIVCANTGFRGSGLVSRTYVFDDRTPGMTRERRSMSGPSWPSWHSALEQAFQPKWRSSLPAVGSSDQPTTRPYDDDVRSQATTASASFAWPAGSNATT